MEESFAACPADNSGSRRIISTPRVNARTSLGSCTYHPSGAFDFRAISPTPERLAMTGTPMASASAMTRPKLSYTGVASRTSILESRSGIWVGVTSGCSSAFCGSGLRGDSPATTIQRTSGVRRITSYAYVSPFTGLPAPTKRPNGAGLPNARGDRRSTLNTLVSTGHPTTVASTR